MDKIFANLEKYNFWGDSLPNVGFVRESYLTKIEKYLGNRLIKVLVGQRRTGKSYLLRQIILRLINNGTAPQNILYLNKELTEFDDIRTYHDLDKLVLYYKEKFKINSKIYLFIDEIQNIKGWEKSINAYSQNYVDDYEVFITGSNSKLLSGELASLLSGRYIQFKIFPYNYYEYTRLFKFSENKSSFLRYLQSGGLPELININEEDTKRYYVEALKNTILLRDIIERHNIKDAKLLEDIFKYIVNNASNLLSISNIVNYLASQKRKTHYETIVNYIGYMQETFLIHELERYNLKGKAILSGNKKYYINDLSYKNFLYKGFEYGLGYMLENIVYLYLLNNDFQVYVGYLKNKEIDFIASKGDRVIYIQVTYLLSDKNTIEREFSNLEKIQDNYEKYVISLDDVSLGNKKGIKHILAWEMDKVLL